MNWLVRKKVIRAWLVVRYSQNQISMMLMSQMKWNNQFMRTTRRNICPQKMRKLLKSLFLFPPVLTSKLNKPKKSQQINQKTMKIPSKQPSRKKKASKKLPQLQRQKQSHHQVIYTSQWMTYQPKTFILQKKTNLKQQKQQIKTMFLIFMIQWFLLDSTIRKNNSKMNQWNNQKTMKIPSKQPSPKKKILLKKTCQQMTSKSLRKTCQKHPLKLSKNRFPISMTQ